MRSWYVDLVAGVRAWWSDNTCEAWAPMQSVGQSPGVTDLADARSAWPARVLIPTWNREQVRTNTAKKKLWMKDVCFIKKVGFWIGGLLVTSQFFLKGFQILHTWNHIIISCTCTHCIMLCTYFPRVLTFLWIKILPCKFQTIGGNLFYRVQNWFESIWSFLQNLQKKNRTEKEKRKGKREKGQGGSLSARAGKRPKAHPRSRPNRYPFPLLLLDDRWGPPAGHVIVIFPRRKSRAMSPQQ
jgi:hypothetical protein